MLPGILRRRDEERGRKGGWKEEGKEEESEREREGKIIKMVTLIIMLSDF